MQLPELRSNTQSTPPPAPDFQWNRPRPAPSQYEQRMFARLGARAGGGMRESYPTQMPQPQAGAPQYGHMGPGSFGQPGMGQQSSYWQSRPILRSAGATGPGRKVTAPQLPPTKFSTGLPWDYQQGYGQGMGGMPNQYANMGPNTFQRPMQPGYGGGQMAGYLPQPRPVPGSNVQPRFTVF